MIDVALDRVVSVDDVPLDLAERYAEQAEWDPRTGGSRFVFVVLRPERIQAWREENELPHRTLMRAGEWLV
jgi:hypothetical protein